MFRNICKQSKKGAILLEYSEKARACQAGEFVTTNLEQIARAQEHIDNLKNQGRLHGSTLTMVLDTLADLNSILQRNLRQFEGRERR